LRFIEYVYEADKELEPRSSEEIGNRVSGIRHPQLEHHGFDFFMEQLPREVLIDLVKATRPYGDICGDELVLNKRANHYGYYVPEEEDNN
jgi:hypothetical protein